VTTCQLPRSRPTYEQVEVKIVPFHTMQAYRCDVTPLGLNLSTGWARDQLHDTANFTSGKELRYPLKRRLCGTQSRCGHFGEEHNHLLFMCQHARYRIKRKKRVKLLSYRHVFRVKIPSRNFAHTFYVEWVVRISSPFPLQSHPLTFFVIFFLLTSFRLDIYLCSPPYS
jgi:hypothetical protein